MTIAGHDAIKALDHFTHSLWGVVSTEPEPFWDDVKKNVVAWLIIGGISSVGYMAVVIPGRLERVLINQDAVREDVRGLQSDLTTLKQRIDAIELRQKHQ